MTSAAGFPDAAPPLKVKGPADLIQAVPYLLGFHPAESLVAVALRGARQRLDLTLRLDLSDEADSSDADSNDATSMIVADYLARNRADAAVLVVYTESAHPGSETLGDLPRSSLVDAVARELELRGIAVQDRLLVSRGRWRSYLCTDAACCPPEGLALPSAAAASVVSATATYAGLAVLPSRDALVESLRPVRSVARAGMEQALVRAEEEMTRQFLAGISPADARGQTRALITDTLARFASPPVSVTDDEAARMIVGLADIQMRDEVCDWASGEHREALRPLLTYLVRRAFPPHDVAPLTVLGVVAYQQGDGALASIALDRALLADPTYRLALLAQEALQRGVRPEALRAASRKRIIAFSDEHLHEDEH